MGDFVKTRLGLSLFFLLFFAASALATEPDYPEQVVDGGASFDFQGQTKVSLFTGDAAMSIPLTELSGRNGQTFPLSLGYNSDLQPIVSATNNRSQASEFGLGWGLGLGAVYFDRNATFDDETDDSYFISSPVTGFQELIEVAPDEFRPKNNSFIRVKKTPDNWLLHALDGTQYEFGHLRITGDFDIGCDLTGTYSNFRQDEEIGACVDHKDHVCSVEPGCTAGNCYTVFDIECVLNDFHTNVPAQWDLTKITDNLGNKINISYRDVMGDMDVKYLSYMQAVHYAVDTGFPYPDMCAGSACGEKCNFDTMVQLTQSIPFTEETYIDQITDSTGNRLDFHYTYRSDAPNDYRTGYYGSCGASYPYVGYMPPNLTKEDKIDYIEHYNFLGELVKEISFDFSYLNSGDTENYQKLLLDKIIVSDGTGKIAPGSRFEYAFTYRSASNSWHGHLKDFTNPLGGKTTFFYVDKAYQFKDEAAETGSKGARVSKIQRDNGLGQVTETNYSYEYGHLTTEERLSPLVGYNKVMEVVPGNNGEKVYRFYNDLTNAECGECPDPAGIANFHELDGLLYLTQSKKEDGTIYSSSSKVFEAVELTPGVFDARLLQQTEALETVSSIAVFSGFDEHNGRPRLVSRRGDNVPKWSLTQTEFAHDSYPGMLSDGMLSQVYRTTVYEDTDQSGSITTGDKMLSRGGNEWAQFNGKFLPSNSFEWLDEDEDQVYDVPSPDRLLYTTYGYDSHFNLLQSTDPKAKNTYFFYGDNENNCSSSAEGLNNTLLTCVRNHLGHEKLTDYDTRTLKPNSFTAENGAVTSMLLDGFGEPKAVKLPGDHSYTLKIDRSDPNVLLKQQVTDGAKVKASAEFFDGFGKTVQTAVKETDSPLRAYRTDTSYNEMGEKAYVSEPYRSTEGITGNQLFYVLPNSSAPKTEFTYFPEPMQRRHEIIPAGSSGEKIVFTYGVQSGFYTKTITNEKNHSSTVRFDASGNPVQEDLPDSTFIQKEYDAMDRLIKEKNQLTQETAYGFDSLGRNTLISNPEFGAVNFGFDDAGNLTIESDSRLYDITRHYDDLHRLTDEDYPESPYVGLDVHYDYDTYPYPCYAPANNATGKLTRVSDSTGDYCFYYDARGNIVAKDSIIDGVHYRTYSRFDKSGGTISFLNLNTKTDYEFNEAGQLALASNNLVSASYTHRDDAKPDSMAYGNSVETDYYFNARGMLDGISTQNLLSFFGQQENINFAYGYDLARNLKTENGGTHYYDPLNRLEEVSTPNETFLYDDLGNWENKNGFEYEVDPLTNWINSVSNSQGTITKVLGYDAAGNITSITGRRELEFHHSETGALGDGIMYLWGANDPVSNQSDVRVVFDDGTDHFEWEPEVYGCSPCGEQCGWGRECSGGLSLDNSTVVSGFPEPGTSWYDQQHEDRFFTVLTRNSETTSFGFGPGNRLMEVNYQNAEFLEFGYNFAGERVLEKNSVLDIVYTTIYSAGVPVYRFGEPEQLGPTSSKNPKTKGGKIDKDIKANEGEKA